MIIVTSILLLLFILAIPVSYHIGTEMRARAKGWKVGDYNGLEALALYEWDQHKGQWNVDSAVYRVRKIAPNFYQAGCFQGTYEEMLDRLENKFRTRLAKQWYLNQIAKASRD